LSPMSLPPTMNTDDEHWRAHIRRG
jgi:hypothetical protein